MGKRKNKPNDSDRPQSIQNEDPWNASLSEDIQRQMRELHRERTLLDQRIANLQKALDEREHAFQQCCIEARDIALNMHKWRPLLDPPFQDAPMSILFLGAVSGEWAAQSRYRGQLPGFGGFFVNAAGLKLVIDPGRSTLGNLHMAEIQPNMLDYVIATHSHWDCVRDLPTLIMAATHHDMVSVRTGPPRLRLLATESTLQGRLMDVNAVVEDELFPAHAQIPQARERLSAIPTMNAPAVHAFDLFVRLGGQFSTLEIGRSYPLSKAVQIHTRTSYHHDTFGAPVIPALDIVVREENGRVARCVYLSDTEYRSDLAEIYAADSSLPPIDVLICNVKTLDIRPQTEPPYVGFSRRHLGWKGVLQLTRDFRQRRLLTEKSLVVLRAWGIETVTRLDPSDGVMTATPEKLRIYQEEFIRQTGQRAIVPGQTWVAVGDDGDNAPRTKHIRCPYPPAGAFRRFGKVYYRSEKMAALVRAVRPAVHNTDEILLITGETGCGKDALAESIHLEGVRGGDMVRVNAQTLHDDLGWAHLTGYARGTFTGAEEARVGLLTLAANGTLIIEEAGELPDGIQVRLLTLFETRRYRPLGEAERPLTAQIILTTSKDLETMVRQGKFRRELYFRLQRRVHVPPLRERLQDVRAVVEDWRSRFVPTPPAFEEKILELLEHQSWPGNVRSLQNVLTRLAHGEDWSLEMIQREIDNEHIDDETDENVVAIPDPQERELLEIIPRGQHVKRTYIEDRLPSAHKGTVLRLLNNLIKSGLVQRVGSGPNATYLRKS